MDEGNRENWKCGSCGKSVRGRKRNSGIYNCDVMEEATIVLKVRLPTLTINSSTEPWLALANSVSKFIGCLGCRMSQRPGPAKEDLAFFGKHTSMAVLGNLGRWPRFVGILGRWSLAILSDGQEFVGTLSRWPRVSQHMVLDFSATGQELVSILGRLSGISRQSWPKICQYSW